MRKNCPVSVSYTTKSGWFSSVRFANKSPLALIAPDAVIGAIKVGVALTVKSSNSGLLPNVTSPVALKLVTVVLCKVVGPSATSNEPVISTLPVNVWLASLGKLPLPNDVLPETTIA